MSSLATTLTLTLSAILTGSNDLATSVEAKIKKAFADTLASGTAADQADVIFSDSRTIAASGRDDLDLAGALTNALGGTSVFAKVKAILIVAAAGNTNDVLVGNAAGDGTAGYQGPFGDVDQTIAVKPGGVLLLYAPAAAGLGSVTATTADQLGLANSGSGTGVDYDIIVIGVSA